MTLMTMMMMMMMMHIGKHGIRSAETTRLRRFDRTNTATAEGRDPAQRDRIHREHGATASMFRRCPDFAVS